MIRPSLVVLPLAAAALVVPASLGAHEIDRIFHLGGAGAWDYVTVDDEHNLVYLPRVSHTQVIDGGDGHIVADIPGQKHNHGVALVPAAGRGFISDGKDASVVIFDLRTYRVLGKVRADEDADGIIYDPASNLVLVGCGSAGRMIPISPDVDPLNGSARAGVELGGEPEFLAADGRGEVFVNLVDKDLVAVVDTRAMKIVRRWSVAPGGSPVAIAMDQEKRRLFIGCRRPQKLIVMSADDGRILGDVPIGAGVDATRIDRGLAFASCRDGTLTIAQADTSGAWSVAETVRTRPGARTMDVNSKTHALYLPTAEFGPAPPGGRSQPKPETFMVLVVR
jgi:hypothetical protein